MTEGQPEPGHDFGKDAVVVLKHSRFIALLFLAALVVGLLTGLVADEDYSAETVVEIEVAPVPVLAPTRSDFVPDADAFEALAAGREVADEVAARLNDGRTPEQLLTLIHTRSVASTPLNPVETVFIEADGSTRDAARRLATVWAEVFVEKAEATRVDPEALALLEAAQAAAGERLSTLDPTASRGLDTATENLRAARTRLSTAETSLSQADDGLAFIGSHPEATLADLRVALAALLAEMSDAPFDSVAELTEGLQLRRDFLGASIPQIQAEIGALAQQEEDLTREAAERAAAENALLTAEQSLATAELLSETGFVNATVIGGAPDVSGGVNWPARVGAAAAFGLVAGVAGAFALEYLGPHLRSWWRRSGWAPPEKG
jgi:capsular polysaccharide biosynthesis protein